MNATQNPHTGGKPANGDLTPCLSHVAVCPEEEMGVTGGGREQRGCVCVTIEQDRVRILGQGLNIGLLI